MKGWGGQVVRSDEGVGRTTERADGDGANEGEGRTVEGGGTGVSGGHGTEAEVCWGGRGLKWTRGRIRRGGRGEGGGRTEVGADGGGGESDEGGVADGVVADGF